VRVEGAEGGGVAMRRRYTTSKFCNVLFAYELNRRIQDGRFAAAKTVTVNAFDPGLMPGTGLAREYPAPLRWIWDNVLPRALWLLRATVIANVHTPAQSGAALAEVAAAPTLAGVTGSYFEGRKVIRSSTDSYDGAAAAKLWEVSEELIRDARAA